MKAHIKTPEGIEVQLDGTPSELAAVLKDIKVKSQGTQPKADTHKGKTVKNNLPGLIGSLKEEGFFKKPHTLSEIRMKLKDLGHNYPRTSLSAAMQRQTRSRNLRRFKQHKVYVYAQ